MKSISKFTSVSIEDGLDFILSHLEEPHFPRRISTYLTAKNTPWQIMVSSRDEALARFKQSDLKNCRISAYKYPVPTVRGINAQVPNFVMADLDRKDPIFKTDKSFNECLENTLQNFNNKLHGAKPSVLWSGGGYHLLQPLDADIVLEMESIFTKFNEPSKNLIRYIEREMTNNKADSAHNGSVAFGNCMVRIPGSFNTKYIRFNKAQSEVKIVQRWNGYKPDIKWVLRDYWIYLTQEKNNEILATSHRDQRRLRSQWKRGIDPNQQKKQANKTEWIESLYNKSLDDCRYYCIWRIFVPYFINIRMLSQSETFNLIKNWLDRCSQYKRLSFNAKNSINHALRTVRHFRPVSLVDLKTERPILFARLMG
jgi:hypothetical protein